MDFQTRFAAYGVLVDERERILLALWNEGPRLRWTMPGGGAELTETPEETMVREVAEESGYDVQPVRLLGLDSHWIPAERRLHGTGAMKAVRAVFEARITGGELRNEIGGSTDEARWIPLAEVPGLDRVELVDAAIAMWRGSR
ncbi:MAG TPA: NUDIX domain-containing protein [Candidatus Ruania gallistercoris]|uniref:NUDIX domain-containing protein n=1 Tax=Candidatus Ruania gallistercoris TaxID=2838746 RepID=A0A9D2EIA3_9MICO|nr:NUDIX domain-containing protein [Candidatus Ruania gallistercoris]